MNFCADHESPNWLHLRPPGVTHGSLLSRLLARGSDTSDTRVSTVQHFEAHFAHCEEHSLLLPDGHLLVATRGGDGKARIWEALNYLPLFATISTISHSLLQFSQLFSTLLKGGAVCGALHAALGEPLYLIPKLRSDICQTGATLHCVNCAAAAPRSDRVCGSDCCREKCSFWISFPKPLFLAPQLRWD